MLTILQFDAASITLLDRLLASGRLPQLAKLRARGTWHELDAPATAFAAGAQHSLYSGVPIGEHGLFYPFQWSASDQRVRFMGDFPAPPPIWEQLGSHGTHTLAVDPYESRPPENAPPGTLVCGWQLHDRVVLQRWSTPAHENDRLETLFGKPEAVDEVFGQHTVPEMLALRRRLLRAPGRVADAADVHLREGRFDLVWLTFCAAHVAGHQFWDQTLLDPKGLDDTTAAVLASTLDAVYAGIDHAIGRVLAALPEDASVMVVSPVGMDTNTSRADMLPEMLKAILDGPRTDARPAGSIWKLRALLPKDVRATVARALPERVALDLTARLELRGVDWSRTRAFAHPAENQGYVRLNLRGRERDGIVDPADADSLLDELARGLLSFVDLDGEPAVASVDRVANMAFAAGARSDLLPDLVVRWTDRPAARFTGLRSAEFGSVQRHGVGSGRPGNHTEGDAWALVVPGAAKPSVPSRPPRLEDVAATAAALAGVELERVAGEPLLQPA